jgi:O-antigen ligase
MAIGELSGGRPVALQRRSTAGALGIGLALVLMLILAALGAPLEIVAMGAAGVLALTLLTRPRAALLLFVGLLYANIPVVAAEFHGVPSVVALGAPLLLLGVPVMSYLVIRRKEPVVTPTLFWMIAYLAVQVVSSLMSTDPDAAASMVAAYASEGLLLYVLVTNAVRDWTTLRAAVIVLLVVGAFMGALSIFQDLTNTFSNPYFGFAQTVQPDPLEVVNPDAARRLSGPIGEANRYAQVMLMLVPLALFAFLTATSRRTRILAAIAAIAIIGGMLLTFSRGAGVAMIILVAIAIALRYVRLRDAIALALVILIALFAFAPRYVERIASLEGVASLVASGEAGDNAILGRATSNLASFNVFLDYPAFGVGPGQYVASYSQEYGNELGMRFREESRRAHNMVLEVAADTGIAGVVALGGIFASTLLGLWRVRRRWVSINPVYAAWATAFMLAVIGYLLTAMFLHIAYMRYLWLLMALANSVIWILDQELATRAAARRPA